MYVDVLAALKLSPKVEHQEGVGSSVVDYSCYS